MIYSGTTKRYFYIESVISKLEFHIGEQHRLNGIVDLLCSEQGKQ